MLEYYKHYTILKETLDLFMELEEHRRYNYNPNRQKQSDEYLDTEKKLGEELALNYFLEYNTYSNSDYFFGCSFEIYKKTYNDRFENFKTSFYDSDEIDFITAELEEGVFIHKLKEYRSESFDIQIDNGLNKQIYFSLKRRFEYLSQRTKENGYDLVYNKSSETYSLEYLKQLLEVKKEEVLMDYSDSKLTEKIIALNELGVLDFLAREKSFQHSINSLAVYLSLCLGEKTSSIQSYINPILSKKSDQSKSPYNTEKTVKKTKQKLIQIGCEIM